MEIPQSGPQVPISVDVPPEIAVAWRGYAIAVTAGLMP